MEFFDILDLAGVVALVVAIVNILAALGVIKGDSKEKIANTVQTIISIALTLIGIFAPDLLNFLPFIDSAAELLAELGGLVLVAIPILVKLGNMFHDVFSKVPIADRTIGYSLTPK